MHDIRLIMTSHALDEALKDDVSEAEILETVVQGRRIEIRPESSTVVCWGRVGGRILHVVTQWPWDPAESTGIRDVVVVTVYDPRRDPRKRFLPPEYIKRRRRRNSG